MVTCTVSIDATGDLIIQTEDASENLETGTETGFVIETKRSSSGSRRVSAKEVKNIFAAARAQEKETEIQETEISKENTNSSAPEENTDTPSPEENTNTSSPEEVLGEGEQCPAPQIITQNMRSGDRNGNFSSWQGSTISEVKILQAHLNRLGFASGEEDGILGPITDGAIKRMQISLGTPPDGYVGPLSRALVNTSCGK
jgi:murein L,D-transpeptidase YcbB/YkuD